MSSIIDFKGVLHVLSADVVMPAFALHNAIAVDESVFGGPIELANGASNVALPGIGAGAADITTVETFWFLAYGVITLTWNGAAVVLNGTATAPALFMAHHTSTTTIPLLSNSSGATVLVRWLFGGT
jgi:hypothetical protein